MRRATADRGRFESRLTFGNLPIAAAWREAAWITAGQAVGAVGAIVGVRLLTNLLSPGAYGEFALGLTVATLVTQAILGPLANAFERFFASASETGHLQPYFDAMRSLTGRACLLILGLGVVAAAALVILGFTEWLLLACAAVAFAALSGLELILDGVQNGARHRRVVALHQGLRQWLRPILSVVLLGVVATTSGVAMAAYALASFAVLCSQALVFRSTTGGLHIAAAETAQPALSRQMLAYATPFSVWGVFTWMQASSDRWALQALTTSGQVGLFAIVSQLGAYPLNLMGAMLTQVAAPIVFARVGAGADISRLRSAMQLCGLLAAGMLGTTALLAAAAAVAHRQIFELVVGPQFWSVSFLLPLAILSAGLFNVGQMAALVPMALGDSRALLAPKIGTALLALVLNAAGAYLFGIPGVLGANMLFALCYLAWVAVLALKLFVRLESRVSILKSSHE